MVSKEGHLNIGSLRAGAQRMSDLFFFGFSLDIGHGACGLCTNAVSLRINLLSYHLIDLFNNVSFKTIVILLPKCKCEDDYANEH